MQPPPPPGRSKSRRKQIPMQSIGEQSEITYGSQRVEAPRSTRRGRSPTQKELVGTPAVPGSGTYGRV
eukprot:3573836-Prorocentrum_lima.AAC.1